MLIQTFISEIPIQALTRGVQAPSARSLIPWVFISSLATALRPEDFTAFL